MNRVGTTICLLVLLGAFLPVTLVNASEITVRPFLIDKTLTQRDITTDTIVLTSNYPNRTASIYATVNEISVDTQGEISEFVTPVMTDRTNTPTSWIDISRARIALPAGETTEIPLGIKVHPFAEPGEYHVFVGFVEASKRYIAEQTALAGNADGVIVKITVADERVETMRITAMEVDRFVTDTSQQVVAITVENSGDLSAAPKGELIFYNSRGREISAVPVNTENQLVDPGESETFNALIPLDSGLGRFKANVNLFYGQQQTAGLYDTTSFYMLSRPFLIMLLGFLAIFFIILAILLRRGLAGEQVNEHGDEVRMYVNPNKDHNPHEHDIHLSK